eukprot:TRINITY_DN9041_c1_g2_i2.p1 TRINITY_DN9041_c1_g2~~TRINITY_DN9041_c1_g2_i2.p1  ORF type:complete len:197 (+),score=-18.74 TRINITY_DN9041_c1_g2_i2:387-977(+)
MYVPIAIYIQSQNSITFYLKKIQFRCVQPSIFGIFYMLLQLFDKKPTNFTITQQQLMGKGQQYYCHIFCLFHAQLVFAGFNYFQSLITIQIKSNQLLIKIFFCNFTSIELTLLQDSQLNQVNYLTKQFVKYTHIIDQIQPHIPLLMLNICQHIYIVYSFKQLQIKSIAIFHIIVHNLYILFSNLLYNSNIYCLNKY